MALLIKNGTLVTDKNSFKADLLIDGDKIIRIIKSGERPANAEIEINARGMLVFPGGIDPHVHLHLPTAAGFSTDDFYTGSRAALFGGTTTLIDFVTPQKGQSLTDALKIRKAEAAHCLTDYSFHVSPVEWHNNLPEEIEAIKKQGITSFKVYMAYKDSIGLEDEDIERVMKAVAKTGGIVTMHCELGDEIKELRQKFLAKGKISPEFHPLSRPPQMEAKAVKKAIALAKKTNCQLYIVHVSAEESLKHIRKAQKNGQPVVGETCPHYLLLDDSRYTGNFEQTAPFVLSPPLRKKTDNEALWQGIADKSIQSLGTDHCPFSMKQKQLGLNDFTKIANGAGGIEHRLSLLYTYGVLQNRISPERFVALTSTNPAKIFGLYPQKGALEPGSDADIVIWNPKKERTISVQNHHMNCDSDIFEGFKTKGTPQVVIKAGQIVIRDGVLKEPVSPGQFLYRK